MLFFHKKDKKEKVEEIKAFEASGKVEKVSFNEIESCNQQDPRRINDKNYGKNFVFLEVKSKPNPNLKIVSGKDITDELIDECIDKIDRIYYTINLGITDYIKALVKTHPELCFIAVDKKTGSAVGYLYTFAMTGKSTVDFLLGNISFEKMTESDFLEEGFKGLFNLNIAEFAVVPEYQAKETYHAIFAEFIKAVAKKASEGAYINYYFLEISNVFEKKIAEALGFKLLSESKVEENRKLAGSLFHYRKFNMLQNFDLLFRAYTTKEAVSYLHNVKDYTNILNEDNY